MLAYNKIRDLYCWLVIKVLSLFDRFFQSLKGHQMNCDSENNATIAPAANVSIPKRASNELR